MTKLRHDGGEKHSTDIIDNFRLAVSSASTPKNKQKAIEERNRHYEDQGYVIRRVDNREGAIVTYAIHPILLENGMSSSQDYIYALLIILDEEKYEVEEFCKKGEELGFKYTVKEVE